MGAKKRWCPAASEAITSQQCGEGREERYLCPLDCEYLTEARMHEKPREVAPEEFPNRDVRVTEEFLKRNEPLLTFAAPMLAMAALEAEACDADIREALAALIQTYRTLESGLIYDTKPANPYAASIYTRMRELAQKLAEEIAKQTGSHTLRDADMLGIYVFLESLALQHDNGRRRGRRFLTFLLAYFPPAEAMQGAQAGAEPESGLITG
ncbi:MAG: hypothetical protein IPJ98_26185 [Bryobacterales bacterium]|nr:hypothetical protein [Bryobacterales bacterium]